jgi:hypothetical protein
VQVYVDTAFARMVSDSGIQLNEKFTDMPENASAFIGLEENAVGKKFRERVIAAVQQAKK